MDEADLLGPCAHGTPVLRGDFKREHTDFQVVESVGFEPQGNGDYLWLRLRKRGENTAWLARQLANHFQVEERQVSYAGLKDRQAMTEQWFCIETPQTELSAHWLKEHPQVECLETTRHSGRLGQADMQTNHFRIVLRGLEMLAPDWEQRLALIAERGVPNYFGPQRFGIDGENLKTAERLFSGERINDRFQRGMAISAARSRLFNAVLARRVEADCWDVPVPGEAMIEAVGGGRLILPWPSTVAKERIDSWKAHPSGPLYGLGSSGSKRDAATLELEIFADFEHYCQGLENQRARFGRRPLRMKPRNFYWQLNGDCFNCEFRLGAGEYATVVLREFAALSLP